MDLASPRWFSRHVRRPLQLWIPASHGRLRLGKTRPASLGKEKAERECYAALRLRDDRFVSKDRGVPLKSHADQ